MYCLARSSSELVRFVCVFFFFFVTVLFIFFLSLLFNSRFRYCSFFLVFIFSYSSFSSLSVFVISGDMECVLRVCPIQGKDILITVYIVDIVIFYRVIIFMEAIIFVFFIIVGSNVFLLFLTFFTLK